MANDNILERLREVGRRQAAARYRDESEVQRILRDVVTPVRFSVMWRGVRPRLGD